jgi:16S rRNA (cytosine1402-N4)-methyltransferase
LPPQEHGPASAGHVPVLLQAVVEHLALEPGLVYVDGTVGSAGHYSAVAHRIGPGGVAIGIDRDASALERARRRIAAERISGVECSLVHASFDELERVVTQSGHQDVDRVLLDLGVSSEQLDDPGRGFSFLQDGPLDMRQDRRQSLTAGDVVNGYPGAELEHILREFGEERMARRIAAAIVAHRTRQPIDTTRQLAAVVESVLPRRPGRSHPATRTFQALRMYVGGEVDQLRQGLVQAAELLKLGGRLAVITFHSGEERLVKQTLRQFSRHAGRSDWVLVQVGGVIEPDPAEVRANARSRSAKLRVYQKTEVRQQGGQNSGR